MSGLSVFVSAGERSGDRHAAALAVALRTAAPGCRLAGIGGDAMAGAGVRVICGIERLQAVGLVEAAQAWPAHVAALRAARRELRDGGHGLAVLVDYPGFHGRLARIAHTLRIPVLHYIAPQFWAWGPWRVAAHRRVVTHTAVILPFEEAYFRARHVPATYVGHPLMDRTPTARGDARARLGIPEGTPVLGLFPGSRPGERRMLWPVFRAAAERLCRSRPGLRILVAVGATTDLEGLEDLGTPVPDAGLVGAAADAAIAKSGTTTLELALAGTPHVLAYRVHPLTYAAARLAVAVPWVGLVNLVLERPVVPELLQTAATPEALADAAADLLQPDSPAAAGQRAAFTEIARRLGPPGAAWRTAQLAVELAA